MYLHQNELTIRDALPADAPLLCRWWNDGKVMEHAGFPQGLGTSVEKITQKLLEPDNRTHLLIIESEGLPIGEMNWRREESDHAEIGIKICESDRQEKGFGSRLIAMLCRDLFANRGIARITLNTMLENQRAQHVYEKLGFVKTGVRENLLARPNRKAAHRCGLPAAAAAASTPLWRKGALGTRRCACRPQSNRRNLPHPV